MAPNEVDLKGHSRCKQSLVAQRRGEGQHLRVLLLAGQVLLLAVLRSCQQLGAQVAEFLNQEIIHVQIAESERNIQPNRSSPLKEGKRVSTTSKLP